MEKKNISDSLLFVDKITKDLFKQYVSKDNNRLGKDYCGWNIKNIDDIDYILINYTISFDGSTVDNINNHIKFPLNLLDLNMKYDKLVFIIGLEINRILKLKFGTKGYGY